jgi:hypothetical protein
MDGDLVDLIVKIVGGTILAVIVVVAVSAILTVGPTPESGDPMYGTLQALKSVWSAALILAVPGSIAVLGYILYKLGDSW